MPVYLWKGRTASGRVEAGELVADTQADVFGALRARKIIPTSVRLKPKEISLPFLGKGGVGTREMAIFTRQFATMINAGLPLMQCLEIQIQQVNKPGFKKILREVMTDVESGATLAEALRKHKAAFSDLYVNMVEAGEAGGALDVILVRLANYLEKAAELMRKLKGAMIYPAMIILVSIGAISVLLVFVIPTFAKMYEGMGGSLPLPTQIVIWISHFVKRFFLLIIAFLIGLALGIRAYYRTEQGKAVTDRTLLKLPVVGDLIQKQAIARFSRTLSTLLSSGVAILEALAITAKTSGNKVVEDAVLAARSSISEGETIAGPLSKEKVFPPMVVQMISIGEATGGLDEMLAKVADFYDAEVDQAVANLTAALEPIVIVFLGVVVGGMVIAMYLPIFKLVTLVR